MNRSRASAPRVRRFTVIDAAVTGESNVCSACAEIYLPATRPALAVGCLLRVCGDLPCPTIIVADGPESAPRVRRFTSKMFRSTPPSRVCSACAEIYLI